MKTSRFSPYFCCRDEIATASIVCRVGGQLFFDGRLPWRSRISSLWLRETTLRDEDLLKFSRLPSLRSIELGYTSVSDGGVASLMKHPLLEYLFLWGTRITDESAFVLNRFPSLRMLNVSQTNLTHRGFDRLREGLHDCLIDHSDFGVYFRDHVGADAHEAWLTESETFESNEPTRTAW